MPGVEHEDEHFEVSVLHTVSHISFEPADIAAKLNDGWSLFSHVTFADNSETMYFKRLVRKTPAKR